MFFFMKGIENGDCEVLKKGINESLLFVEAEPADKCDIDNNMHDRVQKWYNLYQGMYLEFNGIHFAHGPFVSHFDMSQKKMVSMEKYSCDVFKVFETVERGEDGLFMSFGLILSNGDIYDAMRDEPLLPELKIKQKSEPDFKIECRKVVWTHLERKNGDEFFICVEKEDDTYELYDINRGSLNKIEGVGEINANSRMAYVVSSGKYRLLI